MASNTNNIKVAVKVRPLIQREIRAKLKEEWRVQGNSIHSINAHYSNSFTFDHIFDQKSQNSDVYSTIADPIVQLCLNGFNGTIFAYGQTSSGKTHTMMGNDEDPGIMTMAIRRLFQGNDSSSDREFMIRVGYIEIYNEKVYDLLAERKVVSVNQNGETDIKLSNKEILVKDEDTVIKILHLGNNLRKAALTKMNQLSSRSHAIFRIIIESKDPSRKSGAVQISFLNLVDLAGSERAEEAGTSGSRLQEGGHINKSLLFLGQAIKALSEGEKYIMYRNSILTRILQASLGGNANTAIVCNITPAALEETASTLGFASLAMNVRTQAMCNEVYSDEALMNKMQEEIDFLKAQLQSKELIDRQRKELEADIASKQSIFLTLSRPINNRRQTWHHMPGVDFGAITLTPVNDSTKKTYPFEIQTPVMLKHRNMLSPTPDRKDLIKQIGQVEQEYNELRQFTLLEQVYGCTKETDIIKNLEKQLETAKEQLQMKSNDQWNLVHQKLSNELICSHCSEMKTGSNSNGMNGLTETNAIDTKLDDDKAFIELQLKELETLRDDNSRLVKQLQELQSDHRNEKQLLEQKIKTAQLAQEKTEILQAEGEITFNQYKNQTTRRISELISQVEELKIQLNSKPSQKVDLNISKIPIKVEATNDAYEMDELKYDLDQLKVADKNNKKIIYDLESKLQSILEEKNVLQNEHSDMSTQIMDFIEEVELLKSNLTKMEAEREGINQKYLVDLKELEELRKSNESNTDLLTEQKRSLSTLEDQNLELKNENLGLQASISTHIQKIELLTSQLGETEAEHEAINQKYLVDLKELEELRKSNESNTNLLTEQKRSLSTLEDQNLELKNENLGLHASISTHIQKIELLTSQLGEMKAEHEAINQKYLVDFKELEELRKSNESNTDLLTEQKKSLSTLEDKNLELKNENLGLQASVSTHIQKIELLTSQLGEMEAEHEVINQKYLVDFKELEELRISNDNNTDLLPEQKEYLSRLDNENTELKAQLEEMRSTKEQVEIECGNHEATLCKLITEVTHFKEKNDFLSNKLIVLEPLKAKNDILCSSVEKLEADNAKLVQQLAEISTKYDSLGESMEATKADFISEIELMKSTYQTTLSAADTELKEMTVRYASAKEKIAELENEVQRLKLVVSNAKDTDVEATNYAALESRYADLQKDYDASRADVEKLESIIDDHLQVIEKTEQECTTIKASLLESYDKIKISMEVTEALNVDYALLREENSNLKNLLDTQLGELDEMSTKLEVLQQQTSELQKVSNEFQAEIDQLKTEKEQHLKNTDELRREISKLETALRHKETQSVELKNEISTLKAQWNEKEEVFKSTTNELTDEIAKLKTVVHEKNDKLTEEIAKLKTLVNEKNEQLVNNVQKLANMKEEISVLKVKLSDKDKKMVGFEATISKLNLVSREKEQQISGWKCEVTRLEKQLGHSDTKKSSPNKDLKDIERKSRRYSQHDESRLSLNETVAPPKNVSIQTDPSNNSCGCETMNAKIQELATSVRMKEASIHTLKLEMRNHPAIGENNDLKQKLHDIQLEMKVLRMNEEHYKAIALRKVGCVDSINKAVQVELPMQVEPPSDTVPIGKNVAPLDTLNYYRINILPDKYHAAKLHIQKLEKALKEKTQMLERNGHQLANGQSQFSSSNGDQHLVNGHDETKEMTKEMDIVKLKDNEIQRISKDKDDLYKKTLLYRELAVSRREEVKRLEAVVKALQEERAQLPE